MQAIADYRLDTSLYLLAYTANPQTNEDKQEYLSLDKETKQVLDKISNGKKQRRLKFFNSKESVTLKINVNGHIPVQGKCY